MNPEARDRFDKKLKKTLAAVAKPKLTTVVRNRLSEDFRSLVGEAAEFGLSAAVDEVSKFFFTRERLLELRQPLTFPTQRVMELGGARLAATFEFSIGDSPEAFAEIPAEVLLKQISSPTLLTKISKKRKGLLAEALAMVRRAPPLAIDLPALAWVMSRAKIPDLYPLLPFLFGEREEDSDTQLLSKLRLQFLRRDKAGKGVAEILGRIAAAEFSDEALADSLRRSPQAAAAFAQLLPKLISKHPDGDPEKIFQKWLVSLPDVPKRMRATVSGALAALCGAILLKERRRPAEDRVLSLVTESIRKLSLEIDADVDGYWGMFPLDVSRGESAGMYISPEGARLLVESLEKLEDSRYEPANILKALASNLGLSQTDEPGMILTYDPKKHQDTVGGLLRDQTAIVVRSGWRYNETLLLKTKVKQQSDYA